jgi:hypothetical protein
VREDVEIEELKAQIEGKLINKYCESLTLHIE